MKICPKCKIAYDNKFKFCKKCGSILKVKIIDQKDFPKDGLLVPSKDVQLSIKNFFYFIFIIIIFGIVVNFYTSVLKYKFYDMGLNTLSNSEELLEMGHIYAKLGSYSSNFSKFFIDKDYNKAFKVYQMSADMGNHSAKYQIAKCYYFGRGVNKNLQEAKKWMTLYVKQNENEKKWGTYPTTEEINKKVEKQFVDMDKWDKIINSTSIVEKTENIKNDNQKVVVPQSFMAIDVVGRNIYLPKNFIRIREEERLLNSSVINKNHGTHIKRTGICLYGIVDNNDKKIGENDSLKRYEVMIGFAESPNFVNIKPNIEEKSLETAFKANMISVNAFSNVKIITKEICTNYNGHKYLKAVYVHKPNDNSNEKMITYYCTTFCDGKLYHITLNAFANVGDRYNKEFDIIFNTFGSVQE